MGIQKLITGSISLKVLSHPSTLIFRYVFKGKNSTVFVHFPRKSMEKNAPNQQNSDNSINKLQVIVIDIDIFFYMNGGV